MTRIIVKNLPSNISTERLRRHFSSQGTITDVKLLKTKDGNSRKVAFIGYRDDTEAHSAIKYFNKSFMDTSKMIVEIALPFGDESLVKLKKKKESNVSENKPKENITDTELEEFLKVHDKGRLIWGNDELPVDNSTHQKSEVIAMSDSSDDEYNENDHTQQIKKTGTTIESNKDKLEASNIPANRFTAVLKGIPFTANESDIKKFFHPLQSTAIRLTQDKKGRPSGKCFVDFESDGDLRKALKYNRRYMGTRYVEVFRDTGTKSEKEGIPQNQRKNFALTKSVPKEPSRDLSFGDSGKIFIRNLSYDCTEEELKAYFETMGPVSSVDLPVSKSNANKGFAYVTYLFPEHAIKALNQLTFKSFQGRLIHIMLSKDSNESDEDETEDYSSKKKQKEQQRIVNKKSWNTLFLNQNAVADYLSKKLGVKKGEILTDSNENSTISLALAETQLVNELKEFFEKEGVNLNSFSEGTEKRSKKIIVCKNIPFGTQERELYELFSKHGDVGRIVLPPTGTIALVEYLDTTQAGKAFRKLAFSKFKHVPLYLEWAPESSFNTAFKPSDKKVYKTIEEDIDEMEHATLFVKNLNFDTTEEDLREFFEKICKVSMVFIAKKPSPKASSGFLSRGYGFVEFQTKNDAKEAMKRLNGKILKDYSIELKLSEKKLSKEPEAIKKTRNLTESSAKLLVKNVPFETTTKDLKKLFSAFGELKNLRLPKKIAGSGSHRGFAFVEYGTMNEARAAFEATSNSTHVLGRRLVVEWAKEDATVEEIRARTADTFVPSEPPSKKQKLVDID